MLMCEYQFIQICSLSLSHKFILYSCRRFHTSLTKNPQWVRERSHEAYAKNYSVVFPNDEPLASRNMRKDPFYEVLNATFMQSIFSLFDLNTY